MGKIRRDYSDQERIDAVTLALSVGGPEASRRLGIPEGTIKRWLAQARGAKGEETGAEALKSMTNEVRMRAVEEASEYVGDYLKRRLTSLADRLYNLAEKGVEKALGVVSKTDEKHQNRDRAAWLRSVIGAMHYGIQDAQLLSGKPTARPEVVDRHEYYITEELITRNPDLVDQVFAARDAADRRSMADRGGKGEPAWLVELRGSNVPEAAASETPGGEAGGD